MVLHLRDITEQERPVARTRNLFIRPSLGSLGHGYVDSAPWNEEQFLRGIPSVDDFPVFILDQAIQHVQMCAAKYEKSGCITQNRQGSSI